MKITRFIIFVLMILMEFSCSEQITITPYIYAKVFTGENSKTWNVKFLERTQNGKIVYTFSDLCIIDDQYTFYANGEHTLTVTFGSVVCNGDSNAKVISDTWTFNNASATLTMILPFLYDSTLPFILREAKKDKLVLEIFYGKNNISSYRIHFEVVEEN